MMTSTRWLGVAWCIASVLGLAPASSFAQQISKLRSTSSHKADRVQMPNHLLHNTGDLTVAIFDDGSIGTDNLSFSGPGITWKGVQGLFVSGVIFGTSERAAVNGLMGDYRNPPANADTRELQSNFAEGFTFDANFDQITEAVLNDEDAPLPYGVDIVQRSYSQTGDPFVFLRYGFINKGANTLDDFYAGIFADWDLGTVFTNGGGYALEEQLVYNFDAAEANGPHFGLVALDGLAGMMTTNNLGNLASPRTDGFANFSIPDGREHSSQGDYYTWIGAGPRNVRSPDTTWYSFAVTAGDNLEDIKNNARAARQKAVALGWVDVAPPTLAPLSTFTFEQITTGPIATEFEYSSGPSWGDFDNDGFLDLFVSSFSLLSKSSLYHNNGDGTFTEVLDSPVTSDDTRSYAGLWGDTSGEGYLDLYVSNGGNATAAPELFSRDFRYVNSGPPFYSFVQDQSSVVTSDSNFTWSSSLVDFDNDGDLDIHVLALAGSTDDIFFVNQGFGTFTPASSLAFLKPGSGRTAGAAIWSDFDSDGDQDVLILRTGPSRPELYFNQLSQSGSVAFVPAGPTDLTASSGRGGSASPADFDNDGDLDILTSMFGGPQFLHKSDGNGGFSLVSQGLLTIDVASTSTAWGDVDNDGDLDLYLTRAGQASRLYLNEGQGNFTSMSFGHAGTIVTNITNSVSAAWGDYDNDGDLDLVVTNSTIDGSNPARNYLYRNDGGNNNHWLSLSLLGTRSNTSGIGATVRVQAVIYGETVEQLREISGSPTGDRAQNSQRAHVGLGDATIVESITITWPSGVVDSYENVSVNTF